MPQSQYEVGERGKGGFKVQTSFWGATLICRNIPVGEVVLSIHSPPNLVLSPSRITTNNNTSNWQKVGLPTHVSPHGLISSTDKDQRLSQRLLVKWNDDRVSVCCFRFTHLCYTDSSRLAGSFFYLKNRTNHKRWCDDPLFHGDSEPNKNEKFVNSPILNPLTHKSNLESCMECTPILSYFHHLISVLHHQKAETLVDLLMLSLRSASLMIRIRRTDWMWRWVEGPCKWLSSFWSAFLEVTGAHSNRVS